MVQEVGLAELNGHLAEWIRAVEKTGAVLLVKRWNETVAEIRPAQPEQENGK